MTVLASLSLSALALSLPAAAGDSPAAAAGSAPVAPGPVVEVGQPAPDFTLPTTDGGTVTLSDHDGVVVLEWFNPDCPFVKYAYDEDLLPAQAKRWAEQDVTWLRINSGAPGKQGHGVERNQRAAADWKLGDAVLLDESGAVGQRYGAKTTPHMYVIADGTLVYVGGMDNAPMGRVEGDARIDYVEAALTSAKAGQPVATPTSKPYGCSVKYGS